MQLAVDARIPRSFKGAGQEAVYIGMPVCLSVSQGAARHVRRHAATPFFLSVCLFVCLYVCLFHPLPACLPACLMVVPPRPFSLLICVFV